MNFTHVIGIIDIFKPKVTLLDLKYTLYLPLNYIFFYMAVTFGGFGETETCQDVKNGIEFPRRRVGYILLGQTRNAEI